VTGANIQSANKEGPGMLNELEEGTELSRDGAGSHSSCWEYVMACFVGVGNDAVTQAPGKQTANAMC
jgi:hypothetical protein